MKIKEIINHFDETLDTKIQVDWDNNVGIFTHNNNTYRIVLSLQDLAQMIDERFNKCIHLSFQLLNNNDYTHDAVLSTKNSLQIFSIIYNAILDNLGDLSNYDAIIFSALSGDGAYLQRSSLYNKLASTIANKQHLNNYTLKSSKQLKQLSILTKHIISNNLLTTIQNNYDNN